jgi:hypothetical protein
MARFSAEPTSSRDGRRPQSRMTDMRRKEAHMHDNALDALPYDDAFDALPQSVMDLRRWISDWYDHAFKVGFVEPPFRLDEAILERLEGYFRAGLTPAEGAIAFFGFVH